ncbi:hypothetical protein DTO166G4_7399 [Paecilomyces variotii]|nr:hypothetical protein DTO164E3_2002 [Paecilomyces variotii]KAJ9211007.1 hypothetical protein DTO166G4_7399 [Paecilomyces variotii]KAJ9221732.1 hypothetical protein DTO169C6_5878 [Paecilomyces variotii]KAJ9228061.1 hypothetical protein DTO166G5_8866 [Paecilomyces variotii]KAJ9267905.1 hypothetical protein DTO195F2_239 [Paecilomyces variotii]
MASLLEVAAATSSAILRLATFFFLRWIPGSVIPSVIFTSLAVYLTSLRALLAQPADGETSTSKTQDSEQKVKDESKSSAIDEFQRRVKSSREDESFSSLLKTLLTGLPSRKSRLSTLVTAGVNVLLALLTFDFLFRGMIFYPTSSLAFSRIGYVSPTTAKLLVREPDRAQLPLVVYHQEASMQPNESWTQEGIIYALDDTTDYTYPVTLKNLKPSTQYRYSLSNNKTGTFITAPTPGSRAASRLSFLTSSCIKPNFPYNPFSHPLRIPGIEYVTEVVSKLPSIFRPSFMLFLGDFIYIDVPMRFGSSQSHYRSEYRRVYKSPSWNVPEESPAIDLPWLHILDDHEISNDWSKGNTTPPYPAAAEPYAHYHVSVNPPIPPSPFAAPENTTYFSFIQGPASFFMLDTRTYRSEPAQPNSTILGSAQLQSLLAYLARPEPADVKWKIVASSVPFTKNWHVGTTDTWGGFLNERRIVFEAMWRAERELGVRIVLLSGDRHEFGATRFPDPSLNLRPDDLLPDTAGDGLHEFSVGPLSMFYLPIRTYYQTDDEDVTVKYVPNGNSKFGLIDIDIYDEENPNLDDPTSPPTPSSVLTYSLYVDGEVVWKYRLAVPLYPPGYAPLKLPPGRVLLDNTVSSGWGLQEALGRFEEHLGWLRDNVREKWWSFLEKERKAERVD